MKKFLVLSMALMSLFYYTTNANAAVLVEPYLGYHVTGEAKNNDNGDKNDLKGSALGARIGYQNLGFMLGLNFHRSQLDVQDWSDDLKFTTYGAFVGYNFPIMLRAWAEYVFAGSGEAGDADFKDFSGYRLGLGLTSLPFVSINLELSQPNVGKSKVFGTSYNEDVDLRTYMLSVSLPLTF